jgi:hypothetical protein
VAVVNKLLNLRVPSDDVMHHAMQRGSIKMVDLLLEREFKTNSRIGNKTL